MPISRVYRHRATTTAENRVPSAPPDPSLSAIVGPDGTVTLSWDPGTDTETPAAGLTYNLRIGTTSGASDVMSPMALADGSRLVPQLGNVGSSTSWALVLPPGVYYWGVQAVDHGFVGSAFAKAPLPIVTGPVVVPETGLSHRFTADLALTKEVVVAGTPLGMEATYTLVVVHRGPHSTAKVAVTDPLPGCLEFVSATADRGSYDGEIWTIGAVKVGEAIALTIATRVTDACTGEVINKAWISSSTLPDPLDPNVLFGPHAARENNQAEATFTVGMSGDRLVLLDGRRFELGRNYPNPFNPQTVIPFSLASSSQVTITVYDVLGRKVRVLAEGMREAGTHEVVFEAGDLPSGMYLVRLETPQGILVKTIQLVK